MFVALNHKDFTKDTTEDTMRKSQFVPGNIHLDGCRRDATFCPVLSTLPLIVHRLFW